MRNRSDLWHSMALMACGLTTIHDNPEGETFTGLRASGNLILRRNDDGFATAPAGRGRRIAHAGAAAFLANGRRAQKQLDATSGRNMIGKLAREIL